MAASRGTSNPGGQSGDHYERPDLHGATWPLSMGPLPTRT